MKVKVLYQNDPERGLTDPLPELSGRRFVHRIYQGDVLMPVFGTFFGEQWFGPKFPNFVLRGKKERAHFFAWRYPFTKKAGYFGWKCYGVDAREYKQWPHGVKEDDVFDGSLALVFTFRPFATINS